MSHTPGPWTWNRDETAMQEFRGYSITGSDGLVIIPPEAIQNEADARLIASAPDLLAALQIWDKAEQHWFEVSDARPYDPEAAARASLARRDAEKGLRAAIAKATGTETTDG